MAYDPKNLSVLKYTNGFTLWHYRTEDTLEEPNAVGYFNQGANMLCPGDRIMANVNADGVSSPSRTFLVTEVQVDSVRVAQVGSVRVANLAEKSDNDG